MKMLKRTRTFLGKLCGVLILIRLATKFVNSDVMGGLWVADIPLCNSLANPATKYSKMFKNYKIVIFNTGRE